MTYIIFGVSISTFVVVVVDVISYVLQCIFFNGDTMNKFFNSPVLGSMNLQQW